MVQDNLYLPVIDNSWIGSGVKQDLGAEIPAVADSVVKGRIAGRVRMIHVDAEVQ